VTPNPNFQRSVLPFNIRPSFATLFGEMGDNGLGLPTFNDMNATYATDGDPMTVHTSNDGTLAWFIQSGMNGLTVARPEITGNDLVNLMYFIRRSSMIGCYPTPYAFPTSEVSTDTTAPIIYSPVAVRVSSTSIRVTWTTDKPTLGLVAAGSPQWAGSAAPYNAYTPLETTYATVHSLTLSGLPATSPTHWAIWCKDLAGNFTTTQDATIA
jgi:hypothetical protein